MRFKEKQLNLKGKELTGDLETCEVEHVRSWIATGSTSEMSQQQ